ncbi:MAG: hypothetical protein ABEH38_03335 [Flavobacteriales bacterium]
MIGSRTAPIWVFLCASFLFWSCSGESDQGSGSSPMTEKEREERSMDTLDKPKAFLLPTPTQVPSLLHNVSATYRSSMLLPSSSLPTAPGKKKKAVQLGGFLIDAAYSGLNDDAGRVEKYAKRVRELSEELYLGALIEKKRLERLKKFADKKASLNEELLSFYREVQKELRQENKKQLGFYVVKGAFIEGLYLSVMLDREASALNSGRVLEQQKNYFKNLRKLREILFRQDEGTPPAWKELEACFKKEGDRIKVDRSKVKRLRKNAFF